MGLKSYKPYTKSTRTTVLVERKNIWKGSPYKPLTRGKHSSGGRNNLGRITSRARGAGHKKRYRIIDFHRNKIDMTGTVDRIEYDPNRSSYIALITYEDKTKTYIICPQNINIGDTLFIIEAMKTLNQIPSPKSGKVKRILIDDATPVEFDSPLVIIE